VTLSAVTLVADRAAHLGHLVAGLVRSAPPVDELVIVDMGSTADPRSVVAALDPGFPVRWVDVAPGPDGALPLARARNAGAEHAMGDALLFLDVDCIPSVATVGAYADAIRRGAGPGPRRGRRPTSRPRPVGVAPPPRPRPRAAR